MFFDFTNDLNLHFNPAHILYFATLIMVTAANPFLTMLLAVALVIDGSFWQVLSAYFVPGLISTATLILILSPIALLIAALKYYNPE
jgi:hypothetical protein